MTAFTRNSFEAEEELQKSRRRKSSASIEPFNLPTALNETDYTGDEIADLRVPDIVLPNLERIRRRESNGVQPLPKGATVCALVDHGRQALFDRPSTKSYLRLGRLVLDDDQLDGETLLALHTLIHDWDFRVPSTFRLRRLALRCSQGWKMGMVERAGELGLSLSSLACVCLMWGIAGQPSVHKSHTTLLTKPMEYLDEQLDCRISIAENLLRGAKGRVL